MCQDYDQRKNMEARNLQMQQLVEEMATRFLGRDINTIVSFEDEQFKAI